MTTLGDHLKALRADLDTKDAIEETLKPLTEAIEARKRTIMDLLKAADLKSVKEDGITVTVSDQWIVKYDPDKWTEVAQWLAVNAPQCLYRQISASKVMELIENGVMLPAGLSTTPLPKLKFLRS